MKKLCTKGTVWAVAASLGLASLTPLAQAEVIAAEQVAAAEGVALRPAADARALLSDTLARADVADGLRARGVDPAEVAARVAALSDAEAQALAREIDAAPAGASDILGTIVFIFVLLLVTDILGFTKIFPFTRSIR
jgi:hypothetical protein